MKVQANKGATRRRLLTRIELAKRLGVYPDTISKWERAGLPVAEPGRRGLASLYELAEVQKWRSDREKTARDNGTVDLTREKARRERAQALVAEQTLAIRARELIPREEVAEVWSAEIAAVRSKLLAWPSTLSDRLHRAAELGGLRGIEKEIKAAVDELLLELSTPAPARARRSSKKKKKAAKKKPGKKATKKKASSRRKGEGRARE